MGANRAPVRAVVAIAMLYVGFGQASDVAADVLKASPGSGSVTLSLTPLASEPGASDERWQIRVQRLAGDVQSGSPLTGTVRVSGVSMDRPDQLGKVDWQLTGQHLSGTVMSPDGGRSLASFKGTIDASGMQGTFTVVTGQTGSWAWEGPVPKEVTTGSAENPQ